MIINGNKKTVAQSSVGVPNMSSALDGWMQSMTCVVASKTVVDFQLVETESQRSIQAVRQPLGQTKLDIKPEGMRQWKWEVLHTTEDFSLDDRIYFNSVKYRVMSKVRWNEYGYIEYEICQDYA